LIVNRKRVFNRGATDSQKQKEEGITPRPGKGGRCLLARRRVSRILHEKKSIFLGGTENVSTGSGKIPATTRSPDRNGSRAKRQREQGSKPVEKRKSLKKKRERAFSRENRRALTFFERRRFLASD